MNNDVTATRGKVILFGLSGYRPADVSLLPMYAGLNDGDVIIDTRSNRYSKNIKSFNDAATGDLFTKNGFAYEWSSALGGHPQDRAVYEADGRINYRKLVAQPYFSAEIDRIVKLVEEGKNVAAFCACKDHQGCHRTRAIGTALQERGIDALHMENLQIIGRQSELWDALDANTRDVSVVPINENSKRPVQKTVHAEPQTQDATLDDGQRLDNVQPMSADALRERMGLTTPEQAAAAQAVEDAGQEDDSPVVPIADLLKGPAEKGHRPTIISDPWAKQLVEKLAAGAAAREAGAQAQIDGALDRWDTLQSLAAMEAAPQFVIAETRTKADRANVAEFLRGKPRANVISLLDEAPSQAQRSQARLKALAAFREQIGKDEALAQMPDNAFGAMTTDSLESQLRMHITVPAAIAISGKANDRDTAHYEAIAALKAFERSGAISKVGLMREDGSIVAGKDVLRALQLTRVAEDRQTSSSERTPIRRAERAEQLLGTEGIINRRWQPNEFVGFQTTRDDFGALHNMANGYPIKIGDVSIPSSEALFQALAFAENPEHQKRIINPAVNAFNAKKIAYNEQRPEWFNEYKVPLMEYSVRLKIAQHADQLLPLIKKAGQFPIHEVVSPQRPDSFWGVVKTSEGFVGMGVLGHLITKVGQEYIQHPERMQRIEPPVLPPIEKTVQVQNTETGSMEERKIRIDPPDLKLLGKPLPVVEIDRALSQATTAQSTHPRVGDKPRAVTEPVLKDTQNFKSWQYVKVAILGSRSKYKFADLTGEMAERIVRAKGVIATGLADGADMNGAEPARKIDPMRVEAYVSNDYYAARARKRGFPNVYVLTESPYFEKATRAWENLHPNPNAPGLLENDGAGKLLSIRNLMQVDGKDLETPVNAVIVDDIPAPNGQVRGGAFTAVGRALERGIPVFRLQVDAERAKAMEYIAGIERGDIRFGDGMGYTRARYGPNLAFRDLTADRELARDFDSMDCTNATLVGVTAHELDFPKKLSGANMQQLKAANAIFLDADMLAANLRNADMPMAAMAHTRAIGAVLENGRFEMMHSQSTDYSRAVMNHANLSKTRWEDCLLDNATAIGADLSNADFSQVRSANNFDIREADVRGAVVNETFLAQAIMTDEQRGQLQHQMQQSQQQTQSQQREAQNLAQTA